MAIGQKMYYDEYKDKTYEELVERLKKEKEFLQSDTLKKMRQEEIDKGIDDNNVVGNVESCISALEKLVQEKKPIMLKERVKEMIDLFFRDKFYAKYVLYRFFTDLEDEEESEQIKLIEYLGNDEIELRNLVGELMQGNDPHEVYEKYKNEMTII